MASFHCAVKSGGGGRGAAHDDYIEREGKYKTADKDDLEHVQTLNLPEWAANSREFWRESDRLERANSSGYREYEIALPREMTPEQRLAFVHEFIATEISDKHVCTFAIHCPLAALEGGEQPHAHIMFSERTHDGIDRKTPEHYFKRADSKQPERGGCKKVNGVRKTDAERKADLVDLRERFAALQNKHLEKNGYTDRVTHLSLAARGLEGPQEGHYGPKAVKVIQAINAAIRPLEKELKRDADELKEITANEIKPITFKEGYVHPPRSAAEVEFLAKLHASVPGGGGDQMLGDAPTVWDSAEHQLLQPLPAPGEVRGPKIEFKTAVKAAAAKVVQVVQASLGDIAARLANARARLAAIRLAEAKAPPAEIVRERVPEAPQAHEAPKAVPTAVPVRKTPQKPVLGPVERARAYARESIADPAAQEAFVAKAEKMAALKDQQGKRPATPLKNVERDR